MYPEQIEFDEAEIKILEAQQHMIFFRTKFNFLNTHNSIRKNKLHLAIAPTGAGKSTFVRSMLCDLVFKNKDKKFLLVLTEETKQEFLEEFSATVPPHEVLSNIRIVSELDSTYSDLEMKETIEQSIDLYKIDMLIIDNITTSKFYMDKTTTEQAKVAMWYKSLSQKTSTFLIAHTNGSEFNNRLLNENDIRGSKTITNITQFLYVIQPIHIGDTLMQFVNVIKHRGINLKGGRFFKLNYSAELKSFDQDAKINFDGIKGFFDERNKLGK